MEGRRRLQGCPLCSIIWTALCSAAEPTLYKSFLYATYRFSLFALIFTTFSIFSPQCRAQHSNATHLLSATSPSDRPYFAMKLFNWMHKNASKPKHHQPEPERPSSKHSDINASGHGGPRPDDFFKPTFNPSKNSKQFMEEVPNRNTWRKRTETISVVLSHEEYALLAIGTFGCDRLGVVEPDFELLESQIGAVEPDSLTLECADENESDTSCNSGDGPCHSQSKNQACTAMVVKRVDQNSDELSTSNTKVYPLERLMDSPAAAHLRSGFFKKSKLRDQILRPLSFLDSLTISRNILSENPPPIIPSDLASDSKKKKTFSSLFKSLLRKSNRSDVAAAVHESPIFDNRFVQKRISYEAHHRDPVLLGKNIGKSKEVFHYSAASSSSTSSSSSSSKASYSSSSKASCSSSKASCSTAEPDSDDDDDDDKMISLDEDSEYWIRTDNDYVVLEL